MEDNIRGITFTCNTQGLPVTSTTWDNNCASTVDRIIVEQKAMLQDTQSSSYVTQLTVQNVNLSSFKDCTLKCDVYSNWVVADQSDFGRQCKWKSTQIHLFFAYMYKCLSERKILDYNYHLMSIPD